MNVSEVVRGRDKTVRGVRLGWKEYQGLPWPKILEQLEKSVPLR